MTAIMPTAEEQKLVADGLARQFGLETVDIRYGLDQDQLFAAAIEHDRGRVRPDGPDDEPKAHATAMGVDGPLSFCILLLNEASPV